MGKDGWRYTWEAQSHTPTLRLMVFPTNKTLNPSLQCQDLNVHLHSSLSFLTLTSSSSSSSLSLRVPIPAVLLDADSPLTFRPLSDHIEVKLHLLLPVDHPVLYDLSLTPPLEALKMESDVKHLSSEGQVSFYCRSCSFELTNNPLRNFVEMPSANWREVADNWFGACCCSFGGVSEKLVTKYVNSYRCAPGICLLSSTSVTLCKDDLVGFRYPQELGQVCSCIAENPRDDGVSKGTRNTELNGERTSMCSDDGGATHAADENSRSAHPENEKLSVKSTCEAAKNKHGQSDFFNSRSDSNDTKDVNVTQTPCCSHMTNIPVEEDSEHPLPGTAKKQHMTTETSEITGNQKSFLNGFLEDVFMARSSNLSKDIYWHEFVCPECTTTVGVYPCCKCHAACQCYEYHTPVDGGVRLFKCYISTCVPTLGSVDMFRKYTVDNMFANRLMECANDESSFRFVIRDLTTKSPVLQMVLINPDTWSCTGYCSSTTEDKDPVPKPLLRPIIKVLFSDCNTATESELRMIEEWAIKNLAESIFMLSCQIYTLERKLMVLKDIYPPSCTSFQGFILSYLQRW